MDFPKFITSVSFLSPGGIFKMMKTTQTEEIQEIKMWRGTEKLTFCMKKIKVFLTIYAP